MSTPATSSAGCDLKSPAIDARPRTVSVNGITIPRGDIARETQNHQAQTPVAAWKKAAAALVVRELLRQRAAALKIEAVPMTDEEGRRETEDEAAMRALVEREVQVPTADSDTCRRYYDSNQARFRSAPLFAARHILLPAAPGDVEARDAARAQAEVLCAGLRTAPESFAGLAMVHSACPSAKVGGNLGQIGPGQTVPEFEKALAMMVPGDAPGIVETRYGLHIVALDQRVDGETIPFDIVQDRIAAYLDDTVRRRAQQHYVELLASEATIIGVDLVPPGQSRDQ
ncbi:MAG: peptidyl-prolyl cis-trans isomerase [Beijerinckiaceae bacterium]|nr:MAG: peptidyl-prolyl cis-trans isomerase [Beijerinckiaceae bacterium]